MYKPILLYIHMGHDWSAIRMYLTVYQYYLLKVSRVSIIAKIATVFVENVLAGIGD